LAQEPWGFSPDVLARLTDFQVLELYLKPAAERADQLKRESPGAARRNDVPAPGGVPSRADFVSAMAAEFGPRGDYGAMWDAMYGGAGGPADRS